MKFRLLGQDVAISEAAESYNTYRKLFIGQAKTAANQFFDAYERNQSLEDVVRKTPDQIAVGRAVHSDTGRPWCLYH